MASSREESSDSDVEKRKKPSSSSSADITSKLQVSVMDLQKILHPDFLEDPLKAAEQTGPRVYKLKNHKNEDVLFYVFGCQGDKKRGQKKVAEYLEETIIKPIFDKIPELKIQYDQIKTDRKLKSEFIKKLFTDYPEFKPDFIVLLGDNFYPNGVDSPEDRRFIEQFYELYHIPCFVVPGNHDFGYTNEEKINYSSPTLAGKARGMHQVSHNYGVHPGDPLLPMTKAEFWRQDEIDINLLSLWNMPWLYSSSYIENLQLFFQDSNHLADDYLKMLELFKLPDDNHDDYLKWYERIKQVDELIRLEKYDDLEKIIKLDLIKAPGDSAKLVLLKFYKLYQMVFLIKAFKECKDAGRTPILFQHHPFADLGSRSRFGDGDASHYFKHDIKRWKRLAAKFGLHEFDYQYSTLLTHIFKTLGIKFAANFAAHIHAMYNVVSPDLCQFVVGTGGGKLQSRVSFKNPEHTGYFLEELGFMAFSCNKKSPEIMNLTVHTVSGRQLSLTNARARPITRIKDSDTVELQKLVLKACNEYALSLAELLTIADEKNKPNIEFYPYLIAKTRNILHEPTLYDVKEMHDIMAYFCQPTLADFQLEVFRLNELMERIPRTQRGENSLYDRINKALKLIRGKTIQELLDVNEEADEDKMQVSSAPKPNS